MESRGQRVSGRGVVLLVTVGDAFPMRLAGSHLLDIFTWWYLLKRLAPQLPGVGSPTKTKGRKVKERRRVCWGGKLTGGHQSPIFTGSFSEVPGATAWEEIHTALSSPRITFSHWLRLFLGTKRDSGRRRLTGFLDCLKTSPPHPGVELRLRMFAAILTDTN